MALVLRRRRLRRSLCQSRSSSPPQDAKLAQHPSLLNEVVGSAGTARAAGEAPFAPPATETSTCGFLAWCVGCCRQRPSEDVFAMASGDPACLVHCAL
eukprot:15451254-Alexandrium_andersonii.AAC.1